MMHKKQKLIVASKKITIDAPNYNESDIQQQDQQSNQMMYSKTKHISHIYHHHCNLLSSVVIKKRSQSIRSSQIKQEPINLIEEDEEEYHSSRYYHSQEPQDQQSQSLVFVKKVTNPDCLKNKLRRMALVPNKVKLQRKDQSSIQCSICLTDLKGTEERKIGKLQCNHIFCFKCILESSKFSNRCPYCRANFTFITKGKKKVQVQQLRRHAQYDEDLDEPCYICGRNDDFERLLECQYCQYAYCHTYCDTRLNSDQPPAGHWFCLSCQELLRNQQNQAQIMDSIYEQQS